MDYEVTYVDDPPFYSGRSDESSDGDFLSTPLHDAAFCGDLSTVEAILNQRNEEGKESEEGPHREEAEEERDQHGCTPLHDAARSGVVRIVELLVTKGRYDVNAVCKARRTPLHEACKFGNVDVVKYMLGLRRYDKDTAMSMKKKGSCSAADDDIGASCSGGADGGMGGGPCKQKIEEEEGDEQLPLLCDVWAADERGRNCLHLAAANGKAAVVALLLFAAAATAEAFTSNEGAANASSSSPSPSSAPNSVSPPSSPHTFKGSVFAMDRRGYTALHLAAARGHLACVKLLVELNHPCATMKRKGEAEKEGAVVPTGEEGDGTPQSHRLCPSLLKGRLDDYPLHLAAMNGHATTIRYLLKKMAETRDTSPRHGSAVSGADAAKKSSVVDVVVGDATPSATTDAPAGFSPSSSSSANPFINSTDRFGRTPYFLAACGDWVEAMGTLKFLGCDTTVPNKKGKQPNA